MRGLRSLSNSLPSSARVRRSGLRPDPPPLSAICAGNDSRCACSGAAIARITRHPRERAGQEIPFPAVRVNCGKKTFRRCGRGKNSCIRRDLRTARGGIREPGRETAGKRPLRLLADGKFVVPRKRGPRARCPHPERCRGRVGHALPSSFAISPASTPWIAASWAIVMPSFTQVRIRVTRVIAITALGAGSRATAASTSSGSGVPSSDAGT